MANSIMKQTISNINTLTFMLPITQLYNHSLLGQSGSAWLAQLDAMSSVDILLIRDDVQSIFTFFANLAL